MTDEEDTKIELSLANIEHDIARIADWLGAIDNESARIHDETREQTAATILAALMVLPSSLASTETPEQRVARLTSTAVTMADALRAELAKGQP